MALINKCCIICNQEFKVSIARKNSAKFCSPKCYWHSLKGKKFHKTGELKKCEICGNEFYVPISLNHQKFCSPDCYYQSKKGRIPWNKRKNMPLSFLQKLHLRPQHFGKGHLPHNKGKAWSDEIKKKMSENRKGKAMGEANPAKRPEQRERNRLKMKKVWESALERQRYSKGWFVRGDPRFKSDPKFIEGMKKAMLLNAERIKGNKYALGRIPHNKLPIPSEQELKDLYEIQNRDAREIAEIYNTNMNTVLHWLEKRGLKKKPSLYGYNQKIFCKAGHRVDSVGERRIADFLFDHSIVYIHNKVISKKNKILKRYDFFLPDFDIYIEYLGLKGKDFYDKKTEEKIEIYNDLGLNVIWIIPGENIQKRLNFLNIRPLSDFS